MTDTRLPGRSYGRVSTGIPMVMGCNFVTKSDKSAELRAIYLTRMCIIGSQADFPTTRAPREPQTRVVLVIRPPPASAGFTQYK